MLNAALHNPNTRRAFDAFLELISRRVEKEEHEGDAGGSFFFSWSSSSLHIYQLYG